MSNPDVKTDQIVGGTPTDSMIGLRSSVGGDLTSEAPWGGTALGSGAPICRAAQPCPPHDPVPVNCLGVEGGEAQKTRAQSRSAPTVKKKSKKETEMESMTVPGKCLYIKRAAADELFGDHTDSQTLTLVTETDQVTGMDQEAKAQLLVTHSQGRPVKFRFTTVRSQPAS